MATASPEPEPIEEPAAESKVAPSTRGMNFFRADRDLARLLELYLEPGLYAHLEPHFSRLGELAGGELDELAAKADRNPPRLHHRDAEGRDRQSIEVHPAYRKMQRIGFSEFGLAAMSHRGGVLGWPEPLPHVAKYAFTFLFTQAEFGLYCPISVTDSLSRVLIKFADKALLDRYLTGLLSTDMEELLQGAMFMTEKAGGSDVGATETIARQEGAAWRLHGEKWFCSNADADLALLLARPEGAAAGTRGLGLFLMPRALADGSPNRYRIIRLKEKLGSRSMPSGEIVLEGAEAYLIGPIDRGFKQIAEMVNVSRLSNGVRACALMRRSMHDALAAARGRVAFGRPIVEHPLLARQLMKIIVPTEESLSVWLLAGHALELADSGDEQGQKLARLLTPLLKFRACRDARRTTGDAMEVRGGNGYIEDWPNPRLVRDAHLGSIWEGTSNMVALDAIGRAVGKEGCERALRDFLVARIAEAEALPGDLRARLEDSVERAAGLAAEIAAGPESELLARHAATALYHATAAALLAWEGSRLARAHGDGRRMLLARLVLDHHLTPRDPLAAGDGSFERRATEALLGEAPLSSEEISELLAL